MANPKAQIEITAQNKMARAFSDAQRQLKGLDRTVQLATRAFAGLSVVAAGREFVQMADRAQRLENRLKLVTRSTGELGDVQERLFSISQGTRSSFEGSVELYSRVARATDALGISQSRLLGVTQTINRAIQVSGASSVEAEAALIQLSQGLAAGALRGEELNSVMEQTPRLAQAIAAGMGVTIGQLREMGKAGEITAETVIKALESQADVINTEFSQMEATVGQATTNLGNSMLRLIGTIDNATGASSGLASAILSVSSALDEVTTEGTRANQVWKFSLEFAKDGVLRMIPFGSAVQVVGAAFTQQGEAAEVAGEKTVTALQEGAVAYQRFLAAIAGTPVQVPKELEKLSLKATVGEREVMRQMPEFDPTGGRSEAEAEELARYRDSLQLKVDALRESLMTESELETTRHTEKLELLTASLEQNVLLEDEYRLLREQLEAEHQERMTEIARSAEDERLANTKKHAIETTSAIVSGLTQATASLASSSKRMFELNKKFAKAEAVVNAYRAIQQVWADPSLPFYAKIAATAITAVKTATNISAINGAQFGGGTTPSAAGTPTVNGNPVPTGGGSNQIITVRGIDPGQFFSGRQLVDLLNQATKDGAKLVLAN